MSKPILILKTNIKILLLNKFGEKWNNNNNNFISFNYLFNNNLTYFCSYYI